MQLKHEKPNVNFMVKAKEQKCKISPPMASLNDTSDVRLIDVGKYNRIRGYNNNNEVLRPQKLP